MEQTAARHNAKRKRVPHKNEGRTFSGTILRLGTLTVIFTALAVLLAGVAVYITPDPGSLTFFAGFFVLALSALFLGITSVKLCPEGIYLCAGVTAAVIAGLLCALCAIFGRLAGYAATIYIGYILASLAFAALFSAIKNRVRTRPRHRR